VLSKEELRASASSDLQAPPSLLILKLPLAEVADAIRGCCNPADVEDVLDRVTAKMLYVALKRWESRAGHSLARLIDEERDETFGGRLGRARPEAGFATQASLADSITHFGMGDIGISPSTVSSWESDKSFPRDEHWDQPEELLDVHWLDLYGMARWMPKE